MHWMVNLTLLVLSGAMALLVFAFGWSPTRAIAVVGAAAAAVCLVLLGLLLVVAGREHRQAFLRTASTTMRKDLEDLLRVLRGRSDGR